MSDLSSLFEDVLRGLLQSFSPSVEQLFSEYQTAVAISSAGSDAELLARLERIFSSFPRSHHRYPSIIKTLSSFAANGPVEILTILTEKFKSEIRRKVGAPSAINLLTSLLFQRTNIYHFHFSRYLTLIILTDLIHGVLATVPLRQPFEKLVALGFQFCGGQPSLPGVEDMLLKTWAQIFQLLSDSSLRSIGICLDQRSDDVNQTRIYRLISRVNGDQAFAESLLVSLQQAKKRKLLVSDILSSLAVLLSKISCDAEVLSEFFKIAWEVRGTQHLKDGAIDVITTLFNRLPSQSKKVSQFFASRVFVHATNDDKVERSARAFLRLIQGDISGAANDSDDALSSIGCKGNFDESHTNTFLTVFFPKSNFGKCRTVFRDILIHLASLNIVEFTEVVTPRFLKIDSHDERYQVFLMAVPLICSQEFRTRSYCQATESQVRGFGGFVRKNLLGYMSTLDVLVRRQDCLFVPDTFQLQTIINEAQDVVTEFLSRNGLTGFDAMRGGLRGRHRSSCEAPPETALVPYILRCIASIFRTEDFSQPEMIRLIVSLSVNDYQLLSAAALDMCSRIYGDEDVRNVYVIECLRMIRESPSSEVRARCLEFLFAKSAVVDNEVEATLLWVFLTDHQQCRALALQYMKQLGALGRSDFHTFVSANSGILTSHFKEVVQSMVHPASPALIQFPEGNVTYENVCNSNCFLLWLVFLAQIWNLLIDQHYSSIFSTLRKYLSELIHSMDKKIKTYQISTLVASSYYLCYFDSFQLDAPDFEQVLRLYESIVTGQQIELKRAVIMATSLMHYQIMPSFVHLLLGNVTSDVYPEVASALTMILQNPMSLQALGDGIYQPVILFLSQLQSYFVELRINDTREIPRTPQFYETLKDMEDLCVNYCILVSAVFNNMEGVTEVEFQVAGRQILVQFLLHWSNFSPPYSRISAYAVNSLIPVLQLGEIFVDGFDFDRSLLDLVLKCQLDGYCILDRLLLFHIDGLLDEFVKQLYLRNRTESVQFRDAIVEAVKSLTDPAPLVSHVGALILAGLFCESECLENGQLLFLDIVRIMRLRPEAEELIKKADNLSFAPTMFQLSTEQVISVALEILRGCCRFTTVRRVVSLLRPWFNNVHLVPKSNYIVQDINAKYRQFTLSSFLSMMYDVSRDFTDELDEVFSELWGVLLDSPDSNMIILLCLFESSDPAKPRVFQYLLHHNPRLISKYLAKRCRFSHWYFMKTQRHQSISSLNWILRVLKSAFTDHGAFGSEVNLVYAMHFSLLFIEESSIIFETLRALCDISCEAKAVWTVDTQSPKGELKVVNVVDSILRGWSMIDKFVAKWAQEAQPWVVACSDAKTARRSLVILNALKPTLGIEFFRLLTTAVSYHISLIAHDRAIVEDVALFVGCCFALFEQHLEQPDIASFAFPFACAFLQCPHFQTNCLDRAMPIFLRCVKDPLLASAARRVLVQAFTPYARQLEINDSARALLVDVVKTSEAPALYIVVAAFLVNKVPFPDLARSYDEIVSNQFSTEQLNLAFFLLTNMTKTASSPLAESVLRVVTDLIKRNEKVVNRDSLTQLYAFAVSRLAISASAVDFITEVARVDPSVAAPSELVPPVQKSPEDVRKEITQLVKQTKDVVPIARCKELSDLHGMIDQKNPPKIYPFAAQYEMYMGLSRGSKAMQLGLTVKFASRSGGIFGLTPNRSFFWAAGMQKVGVLAMQYAPLRKKTVCQTLLDIPVVDNSAWKFVISPAEFLKLDDDERA